MTIREKKKIRRKTNQSKGPGIPGDTQPHRTNAVELWGGGHEKKKDEAERGAAFATKKNKGVDRLEWRNRKLVKTSLTN